MQGNVVRSLTVRGQSQGLDKVKSDLDAVSAAQVKVGQTGETMAKVTETVSRRQLSAASSFDRLAEKNDRMIFLERQMAREQMIVNRAFETGHIDIDRHGQSIAQVSAKYEKLMVAEQAARAQLSATTGAIDQQSASVMRLAAANDNLGAANDNMRHNSANIAAQFQDIGVTAAMGMSPVMIALQQGTQLSAAFNGMKNPILGVGTALMSILNPVSLLTIGFVALTATAIQFFTTSNDNAKESANALEEHRAKLDALLVGYDRAQEAAEGFGDATRVKPEGAVASELLAARAASIEALKASLTEVADEEARIRASVADLSYMGDVDTIAAIEGLDRLGLTANSTTAQLDALITTLTQMANDDAASDKVRKYASDLLPVIERFLQARAEVGEFDAALRALPRDIQIRMTVAQEFGSAMGEIGDLYMDPRSRFDVARENLNNWTQQATATAQTYSELAGVGTEYARVLDSINTAEAEANAKRAASAKATPLEKAADNYRDLIRDARQYISEQELTASTLGLTAEATARLRHEQELLNQAANDSIVLSPAQREEIGALAEQMAAAEERTRSLSESFNFGRDVFKGFFSDLRQGLKEGDSLWDAFFNAASNAIDKLLDKAMSAALDQVWNGLWNSILGGLGGGFGTIGVGGVGMPAGGFIPGLTGPSLNANGNVYQSPSLSAYSNQIHDTPKLFSFANGIGQFAEAGPEAIMPLGRDGSGRLGVRVANQNTPGAANSNVRVEVHNYSGAPVQQETTKGADGVDVTKIIIGTVNAGIADGRLDTSMAATYGLKRRGL